MTLQDISSEAIMMYDPLPPLDNKAAYTKPPRYGHCMSNYSCVLHLYVCVNNSINILEYRNVKLTVDMMGNCCIRTTVIILIVQHNYSYTLGGKYFGEFGFKN